MLVFLNGQFVPEEQAVISIFDRGFLYGDGLFETMRVCNGRVFRWAQHFRRLRQGADFLNIPLSLDGDALGNLARELIQKNKMPEALLRLTISRGIGPRGYSPRNAGPPSVVLSLHPAPDPAASPRWKLLLASVRLPAGEAIAQFKTCNKLPQILARAEADAAGADEALLSNTDGHVVEGAASNFFWLPDANTLCTPPCAAGILPGVTRTAVLEIAASLPLKIREVNVRREELQRAAGAFLSLSSFGIVEAESLDGIAWPPSPRTSKIQKAYRELLQKETR